MSEPLIDVRVNGIPRPQGSMTPITVPKTGRVYMKAPDTMYEWRNNVTMTIRNSLPDDWTALDDVPVALWLDFTLPRPKRHFTKGGILRADAPSYVSNGADLDKLCRAVFDALTMSTVVSDDSHVSLLRAGKTYTNQDVPQAGVRVRVWPL